MPIGQNSTIVESPLKVARRKIDEQFNNFKASRLVRFVYYETAEEHYIPSLKARGIQKFLCIKNDTLTAIEIYSSEIQKVLEAEQRIINDDTRKLPLSCNNGNPIFNGYINSKNTTKTNLEGILEVLKNFDPQKQTQIQTIKGRTTASPRDNYNFVFAAAIAFSLIVRKDENDPISGKKIIINLAEKGGKENFLQSLKIAIDLSEEVIKLRNSTTSVSASIVMVRPGDEGPNAGNVDRPAGGVSHRAGGVGLTTGTRINSVGRAEVIR